tara:strand:+ start:49 stop:1482 length:1434 start_codon:yes stop_codon:yes gene_type:complete
MNTASIAIVFLAPLMLLMPRVGVSLPDQPPPDPSADAARFQAVTSQLDPGGTVHAYVSVDGDLTAIGGFVKSFMDDMRKFEQDIPQVDVPALLKVSGLDAISAAGASSVRIQDGFRNKIYLHVPEGPKAFLRIMGSQSKPFEVLKLAPAGCDLVVEQDLNLKVVYEAVLEAAGIMMGEEGKAMVQGAVKQPLPAPLTFTAEKVLADLDTQVTVILDADPDKMVELPDAEGIQIPQLSGAVMIDGLGWIADELVKAFEPMLAQGNRAPFRVVRNANWVGMQLAIDSETLSVKERKEIKALGFETAMFAHHRPSGKLMLVSDKAFADKLFLPKPGLAQDPAFRKTMAGLPMEGMGLSYASPVFFSSLRKILRKTNELENGMQGEGFFVGTMLDLTFPKNARGEGSVSTTTKNGMLFVANSAHSLKGSMAISLASPMLMAGASVLSVNRAIEDLAEPVEVFEQDLPDPRQDHREFERIGD